MFHCFFFSEPDDLSADELARLVTAKKNSRKAVANPKLKTCAFIIVLNVYCSHLF